MERFLTARFGSGYDLTMKEQRTFKRQITLLFFGFQKISTPLFFYEFTNMESVIEEALHIKRTIYFRDNNVFL